VTVREYEAWAKTSAFRRKLDVALAEINRATLSHFVVSSSWGKDSCALVGLVREALGRRFDVVHLRSPYELPGYERVLDWAHDVSTVTTLETRKSLAEYTAWLTEHGLGYERETIKSAGKARKVDELLTWVRAQGYATQLLGMRADESKARRMCFRVRGLTYPAHGLVMCNPIGWWTSRDVWSYLVSRGIPWHPLYDATTHGYTREQLRNSGWLSVAAHDDGRTAWLRQHYPEQWRQLAAAFPQVRLRS
jgi:3'-phosphoadenosine 5'-phosphosulfate sulfotransferase (PAPS reductase)/FAD synthetase